MRRLVRRDVVTAGPRPRLEVETERTFPGWCPRVLLLVLATAFAGAALQTTGLSQSLVWGAAIGLGAVTAYLPAPPVPHLLVLLGGGLSAALLLVVVQTLATDLRTQRRRTRQDASRGQPDSPDSPGSPDSLGSPGALDAVIARSRGIPAQRVSTEDAPAAGGDTPQDGPRRRGRGGVHRAGPD